MGRKQKKRFELISPDDILDFHGKLIKKHGGTIGEYPDSFNRADSIIAQFQYATIKYKNIESLAAYLIYLFNNKGTYLS